MTATLKPIQVAAYYFPNYHQDTRNQRVHGPGWTEWELVKHARPRWPGHAQPHIPLWGYTDEADPVQMAAKIQAAADHGLDAFIFDWYWYDDGPFLQRALDDGYLHAPNRDQVKFALMWANHDWTDIHPQKLGEMPRVLYPGAVSRATFDFLSEHVISRYFSAPSYWRIDERPYFSIYDLPRLILGLGGLEATAAALRQLRARTRAAGHPDLHLNLVHWQRGILLGEQALPVSAELLKHLGFDSLTSYVWVHHVPIEPFPSMPYAAAWAGMRTYLDEVTSRYRGWPYFPNATVGWDASPRTVQSDGFEPRGYPFMATLADNSPERFRQVLTELRAWLERRPPAERILTVNAWNEWTEGSYLEPDVRHGYGYLEAIRDVFRPRAA